MTQLLVSIALFNGFKEHSQSRERERERKREGEEGGRKITKGLSYEGYYTRRLHMELLRVNLYISAEYYLNKTLVRSSQFTINNRIVFLPHERHLASVKMSKKMYKTSTLIFRDAID